MSRFVAWFCFLILPVLPAAADFKAGTEAFEREDYEAALEAWRPLAEQGLAEAQFNLGLLYASGKGVEEDLAEALGWYRKAAEQGFARAQYRVAEFYEAGQGTEPDLIEAHFWFSLARAQKYSDAKKRKRKVAHRMTPDEIALAEMRARNWKRERKGKD